MSNTTGRRVGIYGTGRAASQIVQALAKSPHKLAASISFLEAQAGQDIGTLTGGAPIGVTVTTDLEGALRSKAFDVLLYAGLSGDILYKAMELCAEAGIDLVHACFVHPRLRLEPSFYERLQQRAAETGARIVGTGMLPGLWLDVLPALMSSALPAPVSIVAESLSDITSWGYGVLNDELGIGKPAEGKQSKIGLILQESAEMIAEVMGLDPVTSERLGGYVIAKDSAEVLGIRVSSGDRIGFDESAVVNHDNEQRVVVRWKGLPSGAFPDFEPKLTVKAIGGDGTEICLNITRPMDPYPGTAACILQAVRGLKGLPGGLHTPVNLTI